MFPTELVDYFAIAGVVLTFTVLPACILWIAHQ